MTFLLNIIFFLLVLLIYDNKATALKDFQIRQICKKERKKSACIKNLQNKRYELLKGNSIRIPVIPYKR